MNQMHIESGVKELRIFSQGDTELFMIVTLGDDSIVNVQFDVRVGGESIGPTQHTAEEAWEKYQGLASWTL